MEIQIKRPAQKPAAINLRKTPGLKILKNYLL